MKIALSLTHSCNLACDYCYAGRSFNRHMSLETAQRAVDFAMERTQPNERIEFAFFGGEPLLRFDLIKQTVQYIHEQTSHSPRQIIFSLTSNGTILTEEILDFLLREHIDYCISLDGPEHVHDRHRVFPNGRGSFHQVVSNLVWALSRLQRIQVNAVYGPTTFEYLPETVAMLLELGVPSIHLNMDILGHWQKEHWERFAPIFQQVADLYIASYERGQEVAINWIDGKIILFLKGGYAETDTCGLGTRQWAIAPSGNIYPCERFIGEDDDPRFQLGNLYTGIDERRRVLIMSQAGNRNEACLRCELRPYCMNWCGCTNYYTTGRIHVAAPVLCAHEKAAIAAARNVLATLTEQDNDLFINHMLHYFQAGHTTPSPSPMEVTHERTYRLAG